MKIIITAATKNEWIQASKQIAALSKVNKTKHQIIFHQSGVGMLSTAVSLMKIIASEKPNLIIQVGIAGTFDDCQSLAKVFVIKQESIGDLGVAEKGQWKDIFDLQLQKNNTPPFLKQLLPNPWLKQYNILKLPAVVAVTVNEITTQKIRKEQILQHYHPTLESMEGAALHYVCRTMGIPFLQLRATSNYIGERNKTKWLLKESIEILNETLVQLIKKL
jgi:futalosine hydrolase